MKMSTTILRSVAVVFSSCWVFGAQAQDPVVVDPAHHKVEFENDQVRVLRIKFEPGESSQMHSHPCLIAIGVRDSSIIFNFPDGTTRPVSMSPGQVVVAKPSVRSPENRGQRPSEVIVVELKSGGC